MGQVPFKDLGRLSRYTLEQIELIDPAVFVAALFSGEIETPRLAIGKNDKRNTRVKCVFERLLDSVFRFPRLFDFNQNGGLPGRVAEGEIGTSLARLIFGPDDIGVPSVPT